MNPAEEGKPQAGLQRRQSQHQLEVLGGEQQGAEADEEAEQVGGQGGAEGPVGEQPHVDQGVGQPPLPAHESHPDQQPGQHATHRQPAWPVLGQLLEPVDRRQHRHQRHPGAAKVQPAGRRVAELRQHQRPQHQQQRHHRHGHEEHRPPPEPLQQHPTHQGADRATDREAGDPHRDGDRSLPWVQEHVADQRQRRGSQGRSGDPQQRPGGDQHARAGRVGGDQRGSPEGGGADQQQPAPADAVAQGAHGDQQPGDQEAVDVHDPQQLGAAGRQVGAEPGNGQVQHGQVHGVHQARQGDHDQPDPLPPPGLGRHGGDRRVVHHPPTRAETTRPSPSRMLDQPPAKSSRSPRVGKPRWMIVIRVRPSSSSKVTCM